MSEAKRAEDKAMRVALIADIHGNLVALDAVLADPERAQVDHVVCLGDVAWGLQPRQTVERLRALGYPTIMGNADDELVHLPSETPTDDNARITLDIARWCAAQLSPADLDYLRTFHPILELSLGAEHTLLCFHGSPHSFHDVFRSTTAEDDLAGMLVGFSATVMAGGHTHEQMLRRYRETIIVNPGSVGLPVERGPGADQARNPPWAEYALVSQENGVLRIELRRVPMTSARSCGPYARAGCRTRSYMLRAGADAGPTQMTGAMENRYGITIVLRLSPLRAASMAAPNSASGNVALMRLFTSMLPSARALIVLG